MTHSYLKLPGFEEVALEKLGLPCHVEPDVVNSQSVPYHNKDYKTL